MIDNYIQAEFKKLVPYKPLTGPELAAIKLAFTRWLEAKLDGEYDNWTLFPHERAAIRALIDDLASFHKEQTKGE
jgi:hypothetical protein